MRHLLTYLDVHRKLVYMTSSTNEGSKKVFNIDNLLMVAVRLMHST